ncbi:uncharacterized protein C1orf146 homolog [Acanthopagrus latus]|uniref:uncharacterized protein C1orf146 homolog n=1 Tax=Acanthopagrus latus TaxID=8177 RepID=UPI00187CB78A|nr:uncharacterized protein C1orf146 homolog [Acanthopagrus latus]XP_036969811.1 uncharacterized protein C1orf146 homolog [Acanthopagrus latus]XP_036969812.1 uncharacterized protein C1orf146 homolog [Acanthopagrus latus]XP_036969813.1 uncharacterized protein C1orf146 homolog [Acanthopagrus latus]XP_036969814.1 uncharacterized protein C1orf146 homolog [Acanthopagrus latus]XP_036969815.1 uncharacterized protein C1orf146 homolog [Acanthopagrus latus]
MDFNRQYNVCSRDRRKVLTVSLIKQIFAVNVLFYQQRVMAAYREATPLWKTTIIVSTSLQNHDTCRMLSAQQHRIRFSDSVGSGAFIFPLSGTAFLLVDPQDLPQRFEDSGLIERIKTFVQVHRNSFLLLFAPFNGKKELEILSVIQSRFFGSNLRILPVRNNTEIVKGLLTIAKATSKPHVDSIRDRMSLARAHVLESSPVWEMLRDFL